jgi:hypothetical protein
MKTEMLQIRTGRIILTAMFMIAISMLFLSVNAQAQDRMGDGDFRKATRLGIGLNLGLPAKKQYDFVIGGELSVQRDFSKVIAGMLSAGYTDFSFDNKNGEPFSSIGFIPVKAGMKIFPGRPFYFSVEAGAAFNTNKGLGTAFVYSPGIGFGFNNGLDLGLRFEDFARNEYGPSQFALRISYGFKLNR